MTSESYFSNPITIDAYISNVKYIRKRITHFNIAANNAITKFECPQNLIEELPILNNNCILINARENRIKEIERLPERLTSLNLSRNRIINFNFQTLTNSLTYLNLAHNFINYIPNLPPNLRTLILCENKLRQLPDLPRTLQVLKVCKNYLQSLPELPNRLQILTCKNNFLRALPNSIHQCDRLVNLKYEKNPNLQIREETLDFIDLLFRTQRQREQQGQKLNPKDIYSDGQNVHDSTIQNDVLGIIRRLMNDKIEVRSLDNCMNEFSNIADHSNTDKLKYLCSVEAKHSQIGYNFGELFVFVWNRIRKSKDKYEIIKILVNELDEMLQVCFTGRISRLINCLSGFDDNINIGISINMQIQSKYNLVKKQLSCRDCDCDSIKYNILFKYIFEDLLKEINIDDDTVKIWLEPFHDIIISYMSDSDDVGDLGQDLLKLDDIYYERFRKEYLG